MIRYFESFAGIGAFRSAFEKVGGFKCIGWCEIDQFAQKAYRALYDTGGEIFYEDITKIDYGSMPDFDLLVGGPCCQSFSVAGRRLAFEDDRGNLFFNYIQILEAKRPRYFIAENVPNLLGISQGECYRIILEKISELGYSMCWRVLNSASFGVPQSRRRLFLVGYLGDRCPSEILAFGGNDAENCGKRKPEQLIGGSQGSRVYSTDGSAVTQCSGSGGMGGKTGLYFIDCNPDPQITDAARCITARQNSGVSHHKGEHSAVFVDDAPRAIINPFKETTRQNGRRIKNPNEPMFTLTVTDRHGVIHKGRIRRLMPIECWKLQGFTKEQFEKVQATGISDAQLYKQAGNSITVAVVEAIARNLLKFDEEINKSCVTLYTYYPSDSVKTQTDALGNVTSFKYDAYGKVIEKTNPDGTVNVTEYDGLQREKSAYFKSSANADNQILTSTTYEFENGKLRTIKTTYITAEKQVVTETLADFRGNAVQEKTNGEVKRTSTYYANGQLKSQTDVLGNTTKYESLQAADVEIKR